MEDSLIVALLHSFQFSSTARTEIATRKLLRANSQAPENIVPPYSKNEAAEVHASEMSGKRANKRHRSPSEDEETSHTKRRISGACIDMHQHRPEDAFTSAVEAYETVTVHLESIKRVDGSVEQSAEIKVQVGRPEESVNIISEGVSEFAPNDGNGTFTYQSPTRMRNHQVITRENEPIQAFTDANEAASLQGDLKLTEHPTSRKGRKWV